MDIKIATGGNHTKVHDFCLHFKKIRWAWRAESEKKSCTFVWFFHRSDLNIQLIAACHVSNERKPIFDQIYNLFFLVEFLP